MIVVVVVAVAAILLIAGLAWLARTKRNQHRHVEADKIRGAAKEETLHVRLQEALADETAAKARAAQAEADVKAAQASGLQQQAAPTATRQPPPVTNSTSSGIARTSWIRTRRHPKPRSPLTTVNPSINDGVIVDVLTGTSDSGGVASSMSWPSAVKVASSSSTKADRTDGAWPSVTPARVLALQHKRVGYDIERGEGEIWVRQSVAHPAQLAGRQTRSP